MGNNEDKDYFSDLLANKNGNNKRLILLNTGGIGFVTDRCLRKALKSERLKTICVNYDVDLVCLTETNKDWWMVNQSNTIWNRTKSWREMRRAQVGHSISRPARNKFLGVGNAMVALDDLVYRISDQGYAHRLLGR